MNKIINIILENKVKVLLLFIAIFIASFFLMSNVKVNYYLVDYLPEKVNSTKALGVMQEEFATNITNCNVMLKGVSIAEALEYKAKLGELEGVLEIQFLDDTVALNMPLEMIDSKVSGSWYKNEKALFVLSVDEAMDVKTVKEIREIIGDRGVISGSLVNTVGIQTDNTDEIMQIMFILIPIIIVIVALTASSYFESLLLILVSAFAMVISMGTNMLFGEISSLTRVAAMILLPAMVMCFSITLLQRFKKEREKNLDVETAMENAMVLSYGTMMASVFIAMAIFIAMTFMDFKLGIDLGRVLLKDVIISFGCSFKLLPVLVVMCAKMIDMTKKRWSLSSIKLPSGVNTLFVIIFFIILVPCYLGSMSNTYNYGSAKIMHDESRIGKELIEIENEFGKTNQVVLMVPKGDFAKEAQLIESLKEEKRITSITSYITSVGEMIPLEFVPKEKSSLLISENYSRIILYLDAEPEGEETFNLIEQIREVASEHYDDYYLAGTSASSYDLRDVAGSDMTKTTIASIIIIALILIIIFRSIALPLIILLVGQATIWINLTYLYFVGNNLNYVSHLISFGIILGAVTMYAIILTNRYLVNREKNQAKEAVSGAVSDSFTTILVSGMILAIVGFLLEFNTTNLIIAQIGYLLGRGTIISMILVLFVLPGLLRLFDKLIEKTTMNSEFAKGKK